MFREELSEIKKAQVAKRYKNGERSVLIAADFGITDAYVRLISNRAGVFRKENQRGKYIGNKGPRKKAAPVPRPLVVPNDAEARRLTARGMGITAVAAQLRMRYADVIRAIA